MPVLAAALLAIAAGTSALYAVRLAVDFLPRLNLQVSPLAEAPALTQSGRPPLADQVILVIADGLTLRDSHAPYLDSLRARGSHGAASSHPPTISRPNYVSIVTGVPPAASGVRTNDYDWPVKLDSIMSRVKASGGRAAFVSDNSGGFPQMFAHTMEDVVYAPWPNGWVKAAQLQLDRSYPLLILLLGAADNAGHLEGADSDEYRSAVIGLDRDLRTALEDLDFDRSAVIIVADHGHTDGGGHGGVEPEVLTVPLIMAGAGIRRGATFDEARLIDIAPTIAALLGARPPGHALGRTLVEALDVPVERAAGFRAADRERIERNQELVDEGVHRADRRVATNRVSRIALAISALAIAVIALVIGRRTRALVIDWRVLFFAVPAFPLAFYLFLQLFGQFSLSSLPDEGDGIRKLFYFGLGSTAVHVLAAHLVLRNRVIVAQRLAAANALVVCGLLTAGLPALLAWAIFGAGPYVELPSAPMLFLIPALYVAVGAYAIAAAVTMGLEIVIFFARVFDPRLALRRAEARLARERTRLSQEIAPVAIDESRDVTPVSHRSASSNRAKS